MSDLEGDAVPMDDEFDDLDDEDMEEFEKILDPNSALKEVLKKALQYGKLARGLRECVKALDRREALICVLASQVFFFFFCFITFLLLKPIKIPSPSFSPPPVRRTRLR